VSLGADRTGAPEKRQWPRNEAGGYEVLGVAELRGFEVTAFLVTKFTVTKLTVAKFEVREFREQPRNLELRHSGTS